MNSEEFYITFGYNEAYPINDKHDKKLHRMSYNDCIEFAEAYHKEQTQSTLTDEMIHKKAVEEQGKAEVQEGPLKGLKFDFNLIDYKDGAKWARDQVGNSNGWISVDERLPPEDKYVTVINFLKGRFWEPYKAKLNGGKWNNPETVDEEIIDSSLVSHWREDKLPEPPKQ